MPTFFVVFIYYDGSRTLASPPILLSKSTDER